MACEWCRNEPLTACSEGALLRIDRGSSTNHEDIEWDEQSKSVGVECAADDFMEKVGFCGARPWGNTFFPLSMSTLACLHVVPAASGPTLGNTYDACWTCVCDDLTIQSQTPIEVEMSSRRNLLLEEEISNAHPYDRKVQVLSPF